jgi:hypothetical protein
MGEKHDAPSEHVTLIISQIMTGTGWRSSPAIRRGAERQQKKKERAPRSEFLQAL